MRIKFVNIKNLFKMLGQQRSCFSGENVFFSRVEILKRCDLLCASFYCSQYFKGNNIMFLRIHHTESSVDDAMIQN